jgi:hypothetical protein
VEESFCMTFICAVPGLTHTSSAVDAGTKNEEDVLDPWSPRNLSKNRSEFLLSLFLSSRR